MVRGYKDLRVWQDGMSVVESVYRLTQSFPKHEIYSLSSQLRRAAVSVPVNIAEGHNREHLKEYLHFLSIAQGSLGELETEVEIAKRLDYLTAETTASLLQAIGTLGRQLRTLRHSLSKSRAGAQDV